MMEAEDIAGRRGGGGGGGGGGCGCRGGDEVGEGAAGIVCEFGEEGLCFGFGERSHFGDWEEGGLKWGF